MRPPFWDKALASLLLCLLLTLDIAWGAPLRGMLTSKSGSTSTTPNDLDGSRWDLMNCINENQESNTPTTQTMARSPKPASLQIVGIWWSKKKAKVPLTITTQMSASRLWQLKALCKAYSGPVAVALYIGVHQGRAAMDPGLLNDVIDHTGQFFNIMEKHGACKLDLMLVREVLTKTELKIWYPINQLRNYARLMARTPLVGFMDGDLLVSSSIERELRVLANKEELMRDVLEKKRVYVLPAFQTPSMPLELAVQLAEKAIRYNKSDLRKLYDARTIVEFDPGKPGHNATNYNQWFNTSQPYTIQYESRYEPWVICDRINAPWHDNIFKGYGLNKIIHLESLNASGYEFRVHPSAFLIHRAHAATEVKKMVLKAKLSAASPAEFNSSNSHPAKKKFISVLQRFGDPVATYAYITGLGERVRQEMTEGTYAATVDKVIRVCTEELSWWAGQVTKIA